MDILCDQQGAPQSEDQQEQDATPQSDNSDEEDVSSDEDVELVNLCDELEDDDFDNVTLD